MSDFTPSADWQGVALYLGDSDEPVWVTDAMSDESIAEYIEGEFQRELCITRLKRIIAALS